MLAVVGCAAPPSNAGTENATGDDSNTLVGKPAGSYVVPRLYGGTGSLKDFRGHAVLANVWATWCPPCRHEMPALQRISKLYAHRGLIVVGLDQGESAAVVTKFVRSIGVTYPILLDADQQYGSAFRVVGLPTSVFARPDGTIAAVAIGELSYERMVTLSDMAVPKTR